MQEGSIECKVCRFWIQYVEEDPILGPGLSDGNMYPHCDQPSNPLGRNESLRDV